VVSLFGCRDQVAGIRPHDGGMEAPPDLGRETPTEPPYCPGDAVGGGLCPLNFCGQLKSVAALPSNQVAQSGADALCNMGRVCVVGAPVAAGDAFQLTCEDAMTGARPFGAACSKTTAGMRCASDSLCVEATDFPGMPFCSALCRNDADCPSDASGPARCIEHQTAMLPNGSFARVGMCTPPSKIAATACVRESGCPANQGCVLLGPRTSLRVCRAGGPKALGTACAAASECRSGECFDRDFNVPSVAAGNRAQCSGTCAVSSDCGADQRCVRLVVGNNGTLDDPLDDLVSGYCQTLFPPFASSDCATDANCIARQDGSDTCDTAHGVCYKRAAVAGSPCTRNTDCMVGGVCSTGPRFTGGYCQIFGCSPTATSGVDACPGTAGACAQRGGPDEPIAGCYEGCTTSACSRASEGYSCEPPTAGKPASICLVRGGA
jgi:hypothetical protein